jgi:hypothetical protein
MEILKLLKTFVKAGIVVLLPFVFSVVMTLLCCLGAAFITWIEGDNFYASFLQVSHLTGFYVIWFVLGVLILFWHYVVD